MKFIVNRLLMYEAVKTVLKAVSSNREIPEIGGILIDVDADSGMLTLTGTDIRTHIQRRLRLEHIKESGNIIVAPILANMLRLLEGEAVEFNAERGLVTLHSGSCCYTISYLEAKAFPKLQIPFPEDTIQITGINSLIKRTIFAADEKVTDPQKAALSYVKLSFQNGMTTAEATDGSCMAVAASPHCADGELEITLHEKALNILNSTVKPDDVLYAGIVGKYAVLMKEDMFFSSMMFAGKPLDFDRILDEIQTIYKATVDARQFYELAIGLSAVLSATDDHCVDLWIEADSVRFQEKTERCTSSSHIQAKATVPTPEEGFHYQAKLLIDCLHHLVGPVQLGIDRRGFALLEGNGCRYCICPRGPARITTRNDSHKENTPKSKKAKTVAAKAA